MMKSLRVAAVVSGVVMLSGCTATGATPTPSAAKTVDLSGSVTVPLDYMDVMKGESRNAVGAPCKASPAFADVAAGGQVVVTDDSDKTVALGTIEAGTLKAGPTSTAFDALCEFNFSISGVPAGSKFYGIHVGDNERSVKQVPEAEIQAPVLIELSK